MPKIPVPLPSLPPGKGSLNGYFSHSFEEVAADVILYLLLIFHIFVVDDMTTMIILMTMIIIFMTIMMTTSITRWRTISS